MAVIRSGITSDELTVDSGSKAARVTLYDTSGNALSSNSSPMPSVAKPLPYGTLGHYRQARRFLMNTSQAAGVLWEFQWTNASNLAVITRVTLKGIQIANATAEELRFNLKVARVFTTADTTNTASILPTGSNQKLRTSMGTTLATAIRESNSATAAAGGTKTLDTDSIAQGSFFSYGTLITTATGNQAVTIFDYQPGTGIDGEHPLVVSSTGGGEGWAISLEATKGATQGVVLILEHAWAEVAAF